MKRMIVLLPLMIALVGYWSLPVYGQTARLPREKIPQTILDQVRLIQADFVIALQRDCPPQACFPRACVYSSHEVVTMQGDTLLPGLTTEGKPRVTSEPQYILTGVTCEYAHEEQLKELETTALNKRLTAKLSGGILQVNVRAISMPKPPSSDETPAPALSLQDKIPQMLMQHFSWILLFSLLLSGLLLGLWSWRRLGRDSKEAELRHLMLKRRLEREDENGEGEAPPLQPSEEDLLYARLERLRQSLEVHQELVQQRCQQWLEAEEFPTLATCLLLVSPLAPLQLRLGPEHTILLEKFERFSQGFQSTFEQKRLVVETLEKLLALRGQIPGTLGLGLQRLFRYFGPEDLARIITSQELEAQRCLLAVLPFSLLREVLEHIPPSSIYELSQSFWKQNRVSVQGIDGWEQSVHTLFQGVPPKVSCQQNMGPTLPVDAAMLLSLMLVHVTEEQRLHLERQGRKPWLRTLFYPDLLRGVSQDVAQNVLLTCDGRSLAHWFSMLRSDDQKLVWELLPASYREQMQSSVPEQADPNLALDVIRTCGKQLYRKQWREDRTLEQSA